MIILDTNVVSELMNPNPTPSVLKWAQSHPADTFFTTAITKAEIYYGIQSLPHGKRRIGLQSAVDRILSVNLRGRIIAFDSDAAEKYADIRNKRRSVGLSLDQSDMQIAAIACVHNAVIATRNISDFDDCGLKLINPWQAK